MKRSLQDDPWNVLRRVVDSSNGGLMQGWESELCGVGGIPSVLTWPSAADRLSAIASRVRARSALHTLDAGACEAGSSGIARMQAASGL